MARITCPNCGKPNSEGRTTCVRCDTSLDGSSLSGAPSESASPKLIACPACEKQVSSQATACIHCGQPLEPDVPFLDQFAQSSKTPPPRKNPGVAAVLSFLIPGLGQLYTERFLAFLAWIVLVPLGYLLFILPGIVLHLMAIIDAGHGAGVFNDKHGAR